MSLVGFHRVLIATAILFCGFFAVWEGVAYGRDGHLLDLVLAIVFGVATVGLGAYLALLDRFLRRESSG